MSGTVLLFYPGHLGALPVTELDATRQITWDREVKRVPEDAAESMVRHGGFLRALTRAEAAATYELPLATIGEMLAAGVLRKATYQPREGEPTDVVVLDRSTIAALRAALTTGD